MRKRILVLTLSFGSGHIRAAQAIVAEFQTKFPEIEVKMSDALENCSLPFRAFYVWTYWAMIRCAPQLWNKFFHARLERKDEQTTPVWAWKKGCAKVFAEIKNFQPDAIVACEVGASEIAVIARRENLTSAKILNVITDYEAEPIWIKPEIAAFAVPNENVAEQLENWGANSEKIKVCGIPLDASFTEKHDSEKTKARFKLDERQIVLLMGGGMGPTKMDEVAARLLENGKDLQIVAVTGKDVRARHELKKLNDSENVSLKILSWTNEVAALMQAATILVTKPGGVTLSEAAAAGIPLVFFDAIPGPEESNAARFVENGAGVLTRGSQETAREVSRLLNKPEDLRKMSANCKKLAQPKATTKIVNLVWEEINYVPKTEKILPPPKTFGDWKASGLRNENIGGKFEKSVASKN